MSDAFTIVRWRWVFVAIGLNLLSVVARSLAWRTVIDQAVPPPQPRYRLVFAAFSVGLFANAVLPGRIGELARVAVLNRRMPGRRGLWATLVGTVFAHRVFDLVPVLGLIVYVLFTAKIPQWAVTSLDDLRRRRPSACSRSRSRARSSTIARRSTGSAPRGAS